MTGSPLVIVDANLLIYAYDDASPFHAASASWLRSMFEGNEQVGLPLSAVLAFVRISTSQALRGNQFGLMEVLQIVDEWVAQPHVTLMALSPDDWPLLRNWLTRTSARGKFTSDVQIAVLASKYNASVYSADRNFARFPDLRWVNPLLIH